MITNLGRQRMIKSHPPKLPFCRALRLLTSLAGLLACVATTPARAADIEVLTLDSGSKVIVIAGAITEGDGATFRKAAAQIDDATVALESEGGSTIEALEIGETIRIKGFATLAINGTQCVSACGLIWLSGSPRMITQTARIGFHATYTDDRGLKLESGVGNALVGRYLALLNLPRNAVVFATSAPPDKFNWLSAANASSFGIDVQVIDDADPSQSSTSAPSQQQAPVSSQRRDVEKETTEWGEVAGWMVRVDHTLEDSCFAMRVYEDETVLRIGINSADSKYYFLIANHHWESLRDGQTYPINIQFDDEDVWDAPAYGVIIGGSVALWINFSNVDFWGEFGVAKAVKLSRNQKLIGKYLLDGSYKAVEMVVACQKKSHQGRPIRDPFAE